MASLFRARRRRSPEDDSEGEDGSASGRVTRRRLSPEEGALSLAEASASVAAAGAGAESSPGWLSSIVSGARRVISSVLFSSPEEAASGEEEDDDEEDETEDNHGAIVSYNESKLAIEEMVMKETFSRDECDKMVKLIQSRVTDAALPEAPEYGTPKEIPTRNTVVGNDFTGAWRSLSRHRNGTEPVPFSSIGSGSFSPGSPLHASPELLSAAVMEAKKWLEEKRQGLGSKPEDHGPCTLNTDMLNSGFESDMGSPVDLAKSYMQSLPPWQSPFLGSQKFKTPPSAGLHMYDYEGKSKYSVPSSKVTTKEEYLSNFWENLEESRRSRLGSSGSSPDASKVRQYGSTSRLFENDTSIFSSGTDKKVDKPEQNNKGSDKVAGAEPANGHSSPITDKNHVFVDPVDPANDIGNVVKECNAASKVHIEEISQGNQMSSTSVTKDADHDGDVKAPVAEPEIHMESDINSASELRTKDTGPHIHASLNGSTKKTSANGLRDQSNANSGVESSGNDNPSCTNSSTGVPPTSNEVNDPKADAADGDSVENGTRLNSEEPAQVDPKPAYVRRGRKRVVRGTRGRAK
ncbi:hypothetical protein OsI_17732 [Oryza sativa Indica Group]|uniref:Uncharacterized protein n=1 Tax=Oryza sativa subsp. indica TaxID=39946 RepID=B8AVM1_ORYSI|nr:hypothetical protein OsI_17732 [Oryza sativa Indica Group]